MTIIAGTIKKGLGAAHKALAIQMQHFLNVFPELSKFHVGTINVHLDGPMFITQFDVSTPPIKWHPNEDTDRFSFLRVGFRLAIPEFGPPIAALIYHAAASPHHSAAIPNHSNPTFIEIITSKLDFGDNARCSIHVDRHSAIVPAVVLY
jgi:hypothetical protein